MRPRAEGKKRKCPACGSKLGRNHMFKTVDKCMKCGWIRVKPGIKSQIPELAE